MIPIPRLASPPIWNGLNERFIKL